MYLLKSLQKQVFSLVSIEDEILKNSQHPNSTFLVREASLQNASRQDISVLISDGFERKHNKLFNANYCKSRDLTDAHNSILLYHCIP